jgi:hypothetical protein
MKTNIFRKIVQTRFAGVQTRFIASLMMAAAMVFAGCSKDNGNNDDNGNGNGDDNGKGAALSIDKTAIDAAHTAGTYSVAVTSNATWSATVNAGATWCTVAPASGEGNGAVAVSVAENPAIANRNATITIVAGALNKTVTVTQAGVPPALSTDKTAISAAYAAGTYSVAVTSNTAWTVAVNTGATWCTALPATGTSNGTVTVNVAANAATVTRAATVTVAAGAVTRTVSVAQAAQPATPPYAASTQTWTFGEQQWSDAIRIPACNKTSFMNSFTEPQCRSYTLGTNTWYYYNWPYVVANPSTMCPSPWRLPSQSDFNTLVSNTNYSTLISAWGYGGYCTSSGSLYYQGSYAYYWSSTEDDSNFAYSLDYYSGSLYVYYNNKYYGFQVRCVAGTY